MKNLKKVFFVFSLSLFLVFFISVFSVTAEEGTDYLPNLGNVQEPPEEAEWTGQLIEEPPGDAGEPTPGSGDAGEPNRGIFKLDNPFNADSFEDVIKRLAEWLYYIAIPLGVLMILWAGFLFMTSGGNEERIKQAKRTLLWTIVGIIIIIIGAGFITLIKDILGVK